jgi:hypothetical protein
LSLENAVANNFKHILTLLGQLWACHWCDKLWNFEVESVGKLLPGRQGRKLAGMQLKYILGKWIMMELA